MGSYPSVTVQLAKLPHMTTLESFSSSGGEHDNPLMNFYRPDHAVHYREVRETRGLTEPLIILLLIFNNCITYIVEQFRFRSFLLSELLNVL